MRKYHDDVRYEVHWSNSKGPQDKEFASWTNAKSLAVDLAIRNGKATIETRIYSEAGAKSYGVKYIDGQSLYETFNVKVES